MKFKTLMAVAAISVSGALATSAAAAPLTPTQVTIKGQNGDYFGYVKSSDENHCENNRKVSVYKLLGDSPDRAPTRRSATTSPSPTAPTRCGRSATAATSTASSTPT